MNGKKSCVDCKHFKSYSHAANQYEPSDDGWDCTQDIYPVFPEISLLIEEHDIDAANFCDKYEEKMIEFCPCCGTAINQPEKDWVIWSNAWDCDVFPVCSDECKQTEITKAESYFISLDKYPSMYSDSDEYDF